MNRISKWIVRWSPLAWILWCSLFIVWSVTFLALELIGPANPFRITVHVIALAIQTPCLIAYGIVPTIRRRRRNGHGGGKCS